MNRHGSINRHYRLVWNGALGAWIPIAENAPNRRRGRGAARSVAATLVLVVPLAQASPGGGKVVSGTGSISQSGNSTDIHQSSQALSIDWQTFNVSAQQSVDFIQPSVSAVAVNRIADSNGSQILGRLTSNGQIFLINPNGIIFGKDAQINVGGLVASTLDLNDSSLAESSRSFSGSASAAGVMNLGTITASNGGYVALVGNQVINHGVITAQLGTVALGAGSALTLTFSGSSLVHVQVDRSVLKSVADNGGLLRADGGRVVMTAGAKDALLASVVNNTGVVEARTVASRDGTISLLGDPGQGVINVAGTLDASAPDGGTGGRIETNAARVEVADAARVTTAAHGGLYGSWLVDPQDFTVAASGGDMSGATLSAELANTSVTLRSSGGAKSGHGDVNVNDAVSWSSNTVLGLIAANNVNVNASLTATGASAGLAIDPNTANGSAPASGTGRFRLGSYEAINLPNVSPTSTTALVIGGVPYTVLNRLGSQGSITGTDLQGINGNLSGHFAMGSNIDASAASGWNAGAGFAPIGTSVLAFTGTIEGLGHSVENLTINRPATNDVGLFGFAGSTSVIRDLGVTGGSVTGANNVGALVGTNYGGAINGSFSTAKVAGASGVGGLVGVNFAGLDSTTSNYIVGTISYSYATGSVSSAGNYVGGLVGYNQGSVSTTYATGSVSGGTYVGGLAGFIEGNYQEVGSVFNSHATGSVKGAADVGGLVGAIGGGYGGSIDKGWASGSVTGTGAGNVGGLLGYNGGGAILYGASAGTAGTVTNSHATGNVSGSGANIGGLVGLNAGGIFSSSETGGVAGGNEVGGLVGLNGGWNGNYRAAPTGSITGSFATGSVKGATDVGGLVGFNGGGNGSYGIVGTVSNSYANGKVSGTSNVGGLAGNNSFDTSVNNSYATGSVGGTSDIGGLVGLNSGPGGNYGLVGGISKTYSTGKVSGTSGVGGLVGSNGGTVDDSFWDVTTSGQAASAGGTGMTTVQMQQQANFTSATAANGNANPGWDFARTWFMYDGHTYPLLASFMSPLTVAANSGSVTYTGSAYHGANGVTYSIAPAGHLFGTLSFGSTPQPAINVGTYTITPGGLYSDQQGYIIRYGSGTLTVKQLASVAWTGGAAGDWSNAANWAGGALPDYANVAAVTIPAGVTVTYDHGVPGTTTLNTLTSNGNLDIAAGALRIIGNLSTRGFEQGGGALAVGGSFTVNSTSGGVTLGDITAGSLDVSSRAGAVTQLAHAKLTVIGTSNLTADNGVSGAGDVKYSVDLANAADNFGGTVSANASNVALADDSGGIALGNIQGNGTLWVGSQHGPITQVANTAIAWTGATRLVADNGASGAADIKYNIDLVNSGNHVSGAVTAVGSAITLYDALALTVNLTSAGTASLVSAGKLAVSGTIGTDLTTVTTGGIGSTTTFGNTTVGDFLNVTSPGAVTTVTPSTVLEVNGAGTKTHNTHVTVNHVVGAIID